MMNLDICEFELGQILKKFNIKLEGRILMFVDICEFELGQSFKLKKNILDISYTPKMLESLLSTMEAP